MKQALEADDPLKRYWALISCSVFGEEAEEMVRFAKDLIYDESPAVRIRAAEFLGIIDDGDPMSVLYDIVNTRNNEADLLLALNTMTYLRDHLGYEVNPGSIEPAVDSRQIGWRIEHLGNRE
ncbi:MAG: hypothetical protein GVY07_09960 [Bacteroidetes bacterium]|nr:hypothetical protein [Bacteroidota bacterium]